MHTTQTANSFAAAVSRTLREAGMRPLPSGTPRSREGIRVSRTSLPATAYVSVDVDLPRKAARMAADVAEVLTEAGYAVEACERAEGDAPAFYVTRPAATEVCPGKNGRTHDDMLEAHGCCDQCGQFASEAERPADNGRSAERIADHLALQIAMLLETPAPNADAWIRDLMATARVQFQCGHDTEGTVLAKAAQKLAALA